VEKQNMNHQEKYERLLSEEIQKNTAVSSTANNCWVADQLTLRKLTFTINRLEKKAVYYVANELVPQYNKNKKEEFYILTDKGNKVLLMHRKIAGRILRLMRKNNFVPVKYK